MIIKKRVKKTIFFPFSQSLALIIHAQALLHSLGVIQSASFRSRCFYCAMARISSVFERFHPATRNQSRCKEPYKLKIETGILELWPDYYTQCVEFDHEIEILGHGFCNL